MSIFLKIFQKIVSFYKEIIYLLQLNFQNKLQILVRGLVVVGAVGAIMYGLASTLFLSPEKVVKAFYDSLSKRKFDKAFGYVLPENRKKIEGKIEYLKLVNESHIYDLDIHLIEIKDREALVEVNGKFEVKSQEIVRKGEIHNKLTLVKRGLFWYIKGFSE